MGVGYRVEFLGNGEQGWAVTVGGASVQRTYHLSPRDHDAWLDLHQALAADFGTRVPLNRRPFEPPPATARLTPILTEPLSPDILYGYGDPCVLQVLGEGAWYLTATSNDAPQSFPILRSSDLQHWELVSFALPSGAKPAWCLDGPGSDFWAPEIHRVGGEYWLVFSAREEDGRLAIGLARAAHPAGPWRAPERPLLTGGVIDPHLHVTAEGTALLFWKVDDNGVWPRLLAERLGERPALIEALFDAEPDRRTAALAAALWPQVRGGPQMEQFFALQPLIEAAAEDLTAFEARLSAAGEGGRIAEALKTRVFAQPLSADGADLVGAPTLVLQNDQPWEAHLIEGVWVTGAPDGRYVMFYAANDFSTPQYGIGAAVADRPLGPYRKLPAPLLGSGADWVGPGHPSVAPGPDGRPTLFLHAFHPGALGYKAFRAVLCAELDFTGGGVRVG